MTIQGSAATDDPGTFLGYALSDTAVVTEIDASSPSGPSAYLKNADGTLFRIGPAEYFLLKGLANGLMPEDISASCRDEFGLNVLPDTVLQFAEQMVSNAILTHLVVTDAIAADIRPEDLSASLNKPDPLADDDLYDDPLDDDVEDDLDDEFDDMAFLGIRGGRGRRHTDNDTFAGAEDATFVSEDPPGIANERIAARNVKFSDVEPEAEKIRDMEIVLFNPTGLLKFVDRLFWLPAYMLSALVVPIGILAVLTIFHRLAEVGATIFSAGRTFNIVTLLLLSMITVNLAVRLVTGVVIQRHGGQVKRFGITFLLFLVPRFAIDTTAIYKMEREGRVAFFAAALRTRFVLFAVATLLWAISRQSGTVFPQAMAMISQASLFTFIVSGFPLLSGEGYQLLCAYFNKPMLRERSFAYLFGKSKPDQEPPSRGDAWTFGLYGIGALITSALLGVILLAYVSTALEGRFGGTGVVIFLSLLALVVAWFALMKRRGNKIRKTVIKDIIAEKRKAGGQSGSTALVPMGNQGGNALAMSGAQLPAIARPAPLPGPLQGVYGDNAPSARRGKWIRRFLAVGFIVGTTVVAMLPYTYDTGGDFVILANERVEVVTWVASELAEVLVDEGDIVAAGDVLARQVATREAFALQVSQANLDKARAQLQNLMEGATPEEILVAEQDVVRQETELPYLKSEAERAEQLLERGIMPRADAERIIGNYETGKADLNAALANLERVRAAAQASEIAILQADIDRLEAEVAFNANNVSATEIVAPVAGRVVFNEEQRPVPGKYYNAGALVLELVSGNTARAEIKVPEADVGLVEVGETVRLKFWALPGEEQPGFVASLAPVAEDEEFGKIVRVKTSLSNPDGLFRPGMTGYAKIDGAEMRVWEAYTRMFVRFILIELWGWIP